MPPWATPANRGRGWKPGRSLGEGWGVCGGVFWGHLRLRGGAGRGPAVHRGSGRGRGPGRGSPVGAGGFASGAHPAGTRRARGKRLPGGNWAGGQWKGSSPAAPRGSGAPGGTRGLQARESREGTLSGQRPRRDSDLGSAWAGGLLPQSYSVFPIPTALVDAL